MAGAAQDRCKRSGRRARDSFIGCEKKFGWPALYVVILEEVLDALETFLAAEGVRRQRDIYHSNPEGKHSNNTKRCEIKGQWATKE